MIVEDGTTFEKNALKKAIVLGKHIIGLLEEGWTPDIEHGIISNCNACVISDDSGLEVDALGGLPGVHSARFAIIEDSDLSKNSADSANNEKLLRLMKDLPPDKRTARFRCVIAAVKIISSDANDHRSLSDANDYRSEEKNCPTPNINDKKKFKLSLSQPQVFEGICEGRIGFEPVGQNGFGYDPLFIPLGFSETFAQIGAKVKNKISHRAKALEKLKVWLESQYK